MPFREKAKNLFKTKSRSESLSKASTQESDRDRYPSNVYRPEEMPKPKYRAPPKKEHTEKLESFSFTDAWRRKSFQSAYSPMGTRAPSRRTSLFSNHRKSIGGKSDRTNSVTSNDNEGHGARRREGVGHGAAIATTLQTEVEQEGDDDVANVGLSRAQSREHGGFSRPRTADNEKPDGFANGNVNGLHKTMSTAPDHQPFTEKDLALAMKRSHLQVPT